MVKMSGRHIRISVLPVMNNSLAEQILNLLRSQITANSVPYEIAEVGVNLDAIFIPGQHKEIINSNILTSDTP